MLSTFLATGERKAVRSLRLQIGIKHLLILATVALVIIVR